MSFWKKIIGKKKNTKSIVVYERENKKLWDYVRLLTELLEEKDKEIKSLNSEIKKIENNVTSSTKKTIAKKAPVKKAVEKKVPTKKTTKKVETKKKIVAKKAPVKKTVSKKPTEKKELSKEDIIISFMKSKKSFLDYKAISTGTKIPESVVRTMISRMKKKGVALEEKKDGKKKLIKLKK